MKNLPFPILVPKGYKLRITQPYAATDNLAWYKEKGLNLSFHNGVDVVIDSSDPRLTYGSACFCPFPNGWTVKKTFDSPMSTKGNGITLESESFIEDGIEKKIQLVYWHLSKLVEQTNHYFKDIVGYVGNSGMVKPEPSPSCPYCGSHLHFMMYEFFKIDRRWVLQNADNGVGGAIDPMKRFDINNVIYAADTDMMFDLAPLQWAMDKLGLKEGWQKIVYLAKLFKVYK
jgi:hypothetical protein